MQRATVPLRKQPQHPIATETRGGCFMVQLAISDPDLQFAPISVGKVARSACPEMLVDCMDILPI